MGESSLEGSSLIHCLHADSLDHFLARLGVRHLQECPLPIRTVHLYLRSVYRKDGRCRLDGFVTQKVLFRLPFLFFAIHK